ncbi:DUF1002 domain-containing protein [Clostridium estertheticum]|uniref:DUF1002 domain-containing protein n=2 Tax=Clostridium estertheticum TaxID=238834 RepID=A0A1J0GC38_9CLOT|nr:DUF1002 domain-containing protein [Clostridium estertheticum]APC38925.1 hypothetical protein A7L45_02000 [Clostridium estertheticum subsp. estertheticum]MBZ9615126.1 DUF1002 domain-containing protein [Clostridium estertheticum subsp. laramiense]MPQ30155.1 DUF1002 domain-containing protein [Clostridium estertheticum]MPQ60831.1 DUF1002 domain-containing protein [Clostridium estertheticum]WAG75024.1 DUF1002 domain-containing protein [Clostridium estertheticum]
MNKKLVLGIILTAASLFATPINNVYADSYKSVTIGADLTNQQKQNMLKYFNVDSNSASVVEVTSTEEKKYLGDTVSKGQLGNKSISCSYIEPTTTGGLVVNTHNVTWVNASMIKNALITAGIENANVKVSAPFTVSGTAAMTGILKGFENSKDGKKLDEKTKKTANEEVAVTGKLGEKIGQDKASGLINEVKSEVIKDKPKDEEGIKKIVNNVTDNYSYKLSKDDVNNIVGLMTNVNKLNLDYNKVKGQLEGVASTMKNTLQSDKTKSWFAGVCASIGDFFKGIANSLKS